MLHESTGARTGDRRSAVIERSGSPTSWDVDPLASDGPDDVVVVTSTRRLVRLAVAAADAGSRFARRGLKEDAAAWMLAPRRVFDGRPPVEACQELVGFERSIVLHGLGFGLDAEPAEIADLLAADVGDDGDGPEVVVRMPSRASPRRMLVTCWLVDQHAGLRTYAFCAMVTSDPAAFVERVVGRYGVAAARAARFSEGFDPTTALATAMISDALAETLTFASADPGSALASGLDVVVEQRFSA